jgi:hypothetical protein
MSRQYHRGIVLLSHAGARIFSARRGAVEGAKCTAGTLGDFVPNTIDDDHAQTCRWLVAKAQAAVQQAKRST